MDRHRGDRFSDRSGDRFPDRSGDRPGDRSGDGGRNSRMPSRWSSDSPTSQSNRYSRGGGESFSGGRHHPYRVPPQDQPIAGDGPGFRGGPGGFSHQMPQKRGFYGRGSSPEHNDGNKFAKLFIGSVPRTTTEEDIRPLFEEHGDVLEVALIRDKRTGQQQGCCFIKYATSEEADRAIRALHNQYTLPGGSGPIQVRYADGERDNFGTVEHKLFVASLNKQATEKEIEEVFSPYGRVEDVYLMRDEMRQSRGCGFVKFLNREMACAAMNALSGTYVMRGCDQPIIARFANPKKPRPGEQRDGPSFGGPGFGPRSESSSVIRPQFNLDEPVGGNMHPNAWQMSPQTLGPSSQANNHGFDSHPSAKEVATSSAAAGTLGVTGGPTNGSLPSFATSSSSQQSFNSSMAHIHPVAGQQISPLQKPLLSPQDLPPSVQLHHAQQIFASHPLAQTLQPPLQQLGQLQMPPSSQQLPGLGGQLSASQSLIQQNASAVGLQQQGMPTVANQQQFPSSATSQQLLQQPVQQFQSQLPQVLLQQQAQAIQSSVQSSQQVIMQLQQQLHQMQQSNLSQQQGSQTAKPQSPWTGQLLPISGPLATTQAAVMPSTASASFSLPVTTPVVSTCSWTEHTSPEGFKYYYNSVSRESKWEKPEELTMFEQQQKLLLLQPQPQQQQQQQQQKLIVQQLQSPSNTQSNIQIQHPQQVPQTQEVHAQMQARQQAQLQQLLQPSLMYQASGVAGHQNIQNSHYTQLQAATSVIDPARIQQGIQAAQEWAWKNKPAGS